MYQHVDLSYMTGKTCAYYNATSKTAPVTQNDINAIQNDVAEFLGIDLSEQSISLEANAIIVNLFTDYFATEEQKVKIKEILDLNQKKDEQEKREKYNPDDIFKKTNKYTETANIEISENNTNTALIEYKESFFSRFKNFILKILHINR